MYKKSEYTSAEKQKTAEWLFYLLSVVAVAFGAMYLFRGHIMPYHIAYLGMSESEIAAINPRLVALPVALMRVSGGTFIAVGVSAFLITLFSFRKGSVSAWWTLMTLFSISLIPMFFVTVEIAMGVPKGEQQPPWWLTLAMLAILAFALIISFIPSRYYDKVWKKNKNI